MRGLQVVEAVLVTKRLQLHRDDLRLMVRFMMNFKN